MKKPTKRKAKGSKVIIKKQIPIGGVLFFYGATGEACRPQFISDDSMDSNGRVKNHNGIYDIQIGDQIKFHNESLKTESFIGVDEGVHAFLFVLSAIWNQETGDINVTYIPSKDNKSWQQTMDSMKKDNK